MTYKDLNTFNLELDLIDSNAVKASVKNIVLIEVGEMLGMPEFGCKTKSLLFEQIGMFTGSSAQSRISNALYTYENRISNISVTVTTESAQNRIIIGIQYNINEINIQDNVAIRLQ